MHLRTSTVAAIKLLIYIAQRNGELVVVERAAEHIAMTRANASKLAHRLRCGGFLDAIRGPRGGVRLARDPHDILIGDVALYLEQYENTERQNRIENPINSSEAKIDRVLSIWLMDAVEVLNQHSIADFIVPAGAEPKHSTKTRRKLAIQSRLRG